MADAQELNVKWVWTGLCLAFAVVAVLFVYSRSEAKRIEQQNPPLGDTVRLEALELHYVAAGSGPAVVLLHGSTTNLRDFTASIFDPLGRHCRVIAFDRPGHGYSTYAQQFWMNPSEQAAAIHDGLKRMGIERAIWLGHSWAGAVVMAGLLEFPREVTAGVLLGGAAYPWEGGVDWTNHLAGIPLAGPLFTHVLLAPAGRLLMDQQIAAAFVPNGPPPDYRRRTAIDLILRPWHYTLNGRDVRLLSEFLEKQSKRYHTIRQPLLMIHGEADDIVPAWNHADRLIKLLPQAELIKLPETGHAPHHVHPEEVANHVARFACGT